MTLGFLTALWLTPAVAGGISLALPRGSQAKALALWTALASLLVTAALLAANGLEGLSSLTEIGPPLVLGIRYHLAIDGLSWTLVALTALLTLVSVASSWKQDSSKGYWASFLFLEAALFGVFLARDLALFYVFWESVLVPMFFIIGLWGSEGRRHAAMKFFVFTFFGSVFLLFGIIALVQMSYQATGIWTWDIGALRGPASGTAALLTFLAMVLGFGVKIPLVPLHTWLPDAHTEAPAAGSVMLAGVLLKMGVYGLLRIAAPAFPDLSASLIPWLGAIAVINILYGSFCAMVQTDLKRLVAYSSVAHLGFCVLGIVSLTPEGLAGGALQLVNHGLSTGALFLIVGFLYERTHQRGVADFGDLASRAPWLTFFFAFSVLASIGLPGLNGFVGEFLSLSGMARVIPMLAVFGVLGVTFAAVYALPAFQAVCWAEPGPSSVSTRVNDLDFRERLLLGGLAALMLAIGLAPRPLLQVIHHGIEGLPL
ncbi:MAG: complex I subunit 4 family protein [Vicinamibacteria bacterium]